MSEQQVSYDKGFEDGLKHSAKMCDMVCRKQVKDLQRKLEIAVSALEYYADENNWRQSVHTIISEDAWRNNMEFFDMDENNVCGKRARKALEEIGK